MYTYSYTDGKWVSRELTIVFLTIEMKRNSV